MNKPVAWMVYAIDGQSVYVTDNPTDIKSGQRALPLYTEEPLEAVAAERERCARVCISMADDFELEVNQRGLVDRMKQHFGVK